MCYKVNDGWLANRFSESETLRFRPLGPVFHDCISHITLKGNWHLVFLLVQHSNRPQGCVPGGPLGSQAEIMWTHCSGVWVAIINDLWFVLLCRYFLLLEYHFKLICFLPVIRCLDGNYEIMVDILTSVTTMTKSSPRFSMFLRWEDEQEWNHIKVLNKGVQYEHLQIKNSATQSKHRPSVP